MTTDTTTTSQVYHLYPDRLWGREDAREDGLEFDAQLIKFPGWQNVHFELLPPPTSEVYFPIEGGQSGALPEPIVFDAVDEFSQFIDYPQQCWLDDNVKANAECSAVGKGFFPSRDSCGDAG